MKHSNTKMHIEFFFAYIFIFLAVAQFSLADGPIDFIFKAIGQINIVDNYNQYFLGIDFILYLIIFGSALKVTAQKQFGKGVVLGMTIAFSIAMIIFEQQQDFKLGDFYIVAISALVLILGAVFIKKTPKIGEGKWLWISITAIVAFIVLTQANDGEMWDSIYYGPDSLRWVALLMQLIFALAVIYTIKELIRLLTPKKP